MGTVGQLLRSAWFHGLAGRIAERKNMQDMLGPDGAEWRLLHVYGLPGIGKTTLLRWFAETAEHIVPLYIDGQSGLRDTASFLALLQSALLHAGFDLPCGPAPDSLKALSELSRDGGRVVLLLDGLDSWETIHRWLLESWLPGLPEQVRICSAGREPLKGMWLSSPEWSRVVLNEPLGPLHKSEWLQLAAMHGVSDPAYLNVLDRICGGVPFALSMVLDAIARDGEKVLSQPGRAALSRSMERRLLESANMSSSCRRLLHAASFVWTFDYELLNEIMGTQVEDGVFRELCTCSLVSPLPSGGWRVVDGIRDWLRSNAAEKPSFPVRSWVSRAAEAIERLAPPDPDNGRWAEWYAQRLYLTDNEFLRIYFLWGDDTGLELRRAAREELPLLQCMYEEAQLMLAPHRCDDSRQHDYLEAVWEAAPESVNVITRYGRPVAFTCLVPLDRRTVPVLLNNPMFAPYLSGQGWVARPADVSFWIGATSPPMDPKLTGFFVRRTLLPLLRTKRMFTMMPFEEVTGAFESFGFRSLPEYDWTSPGGLVFRALRYVPGEAKEHLAAIEGAGEYQQRTDALLKEALLRFGELERHPELMGRIALYAADPMAVCSAADFCRAVEQYLGWMAKGGKAESRQSRLLQLAYLQKIGSHETVAARLNLPMTTYYRYLRKGIRRLAELLFLPSAF